MTTEKLKLVIQISFLIFALGLLGFYFRDREDTLWFGVGGGLTLVNLIFAYFVIKKGLTSLKSKGAFMFLVLLKSTSFVAVVAAILALLKPRVLPFTLGLALVMFGAVVAALWAARQRS